jgi:hypothetical protein
MQKKHSVSFHPNKRLHRIAIVSLSVFCLLVLNGCKQSSQSNTSTNNHTNQSEKSNNTSSAKQKKSPYSLELIEKHLREIYKGNIEEKIGLQRWEVDELAYFISHHDDNNPAIDESEKNIFRKKFKKYSEITGIKVREELHKIGNVVIIFAKDFFRAISNPPIQRMLFGKRTKEKYQEIYEKFKNNKSSSYVYGVSYAIKSDKINRTYVLFQINEEDKNYLDLWADYIVYSILIPRSGVGNIDGLSNVIEPSILNIKRPKSKYYNQLIQQNKKDFQPIDRYLLEALYSDKIYYGMPMEKAIPIMSKFIYHKLGGVN